MTALERIFQRYPHLTTLRGLVPDDVIVNDVSLKMERFEQYRQTASQKIPSVRLKDIFPLELERGRIVLRDFLGQWENISIEEVCKICLIVRYLKPKKMFEFGTYNGCTTLQMARNAPRICKIYTLDIRPRESANTTHDVGEVDGYLAGKSGAFKFEVGNYFKKNASACRIVQLWGDSAKFDFTSYRGRMDLVFVDAAHTYDYVKADTANALRMIHQDGIVVWHDYLQVLHPDVTRHLYEICDDFPIYHLRGTNLAIGREARK